MKAKNKNLGLMLLFLITLGGFSVQAQTYQATASANSSITVDGTSNIHDWTLKAESFTVKSTIENSEAGLTIKSLSLDLVAEGLKSGKSGMDKNTYKALATDKHKKMTFTSTKTLSVSKASGNTYKAIVQGVLEISGTKKTIDLSFDITQSNNSYIIKGSHSIHMPDYGVTPPTAVLGSIKTGADLKINYNITLN